MGLYLHHPSSLEHDTGPHPENARRIAAIEGALEKAGWPGLERVDAPPATREQLLRVHSASHVEAIESISRAGGGMIDMDTVASAGSYDAALHAAGGAVHAVDRLLQDSSQDGGGAAAGGDGAEAGEAQFAFCALRPPGHHAETQRAMGFCLFNNIAVAAAHALDEHGLERVLILDWDVHHGNGTSEIFSGSDRVLYASIHQSPLYPGTGYPSDTGHGPGEGYTVNMPVPPGAGPDEFLSLVQHVVAPLAAQLRPGLIGISAGYDAHRADPLANCELDEDAYADMAATMRRLGQDLGAHVVVCLEGGYDLEALSASVVATIEALDGGHTAREAPMEPAGPYRERFAGSWPFLSLR